jgi:chromate reductase
MKILGLAGSLRAGSHSARLLDAAAAAFPDDVELVTFDGLGDVPPYDADVDAAGVPGGVAALREAIGGADALLVVTPEYNASVPGVLKNAIDWASRPRETTVLQSLPVAVVSHSPGQFGGLWAADDLVRILKITGARPLEESVSVPQIDSALPDGADLLVEGDRQAALEALASSLVKATAATLTTA